MNYSFEYITVPGELTGNFAYRMKINYFISGKGDIVSSIDLVTDFFRVIEDGKLLSDNIAKAAQEDYNKKSKQAA